MEHHSRRVVAYVAGRVSSGSSSSSVYDYSASNYFSVGGTATAERVAIYDYSIGCHISGNLPSLYHYGDGGHMSLKMDGNRFTGYDYHTGSHFSGTVSGRSVSVYDYEHSTYFNYSV